LVISGVCILFNIEPVNGDYWVPFKKVLGKPNFKVLIMNYDKESITGAMIKKLKPLVEKPEFSREALVPISQAIANFGSWVLDMYESGEGSGVPSLELSPQKSRS
jgi:hypothetical protein